MARYLILDQNGKVLNAVEWDGSDRWVPPAGATMRQTDGGNPGDTWDGAKFTPGPVRVARKTLEERVAAIEARLGP